VTDTNLFRLSQPGPFTVTFVGALFRSSIRGHQSEIMFGVLVVVLGRDPIACPEFSLGQRQVPVIVSSRVVRVSWPRRTRCPPLRAASYPSQSRLTRIHVCLSAIRMAHSVRLAGERSLRTNDKGR